MSVEIDDKDIYQCDKDILFCLKHCVGEVRLIHTMSLKPCRIELVPKDRHCRCVGWELETDFINGSREEWILCRMLAMVGCKSRRLAMFLQKHLVTNSAYNMMMRCAIMRSCPYRMEMLMERWDKEQKEKSKEEGR